MKGIVLILLLAVGFIVNAQPVLNSKDILPSVGESFTYRTFEANGISPGSTGANQTWDFTALQAQANSTIEILNPAVTPNGNDYPQATLCLAQDSLYLYYDTSGSAFSLYGGDNSGNQAIYSNPEQQLSFPLTYPNSGTDFFTGTFDFTVPNLGTFLSFRSGNTTFNVEGYGTLELPGRSYTDVLKVRITSVQLDSINLFLFDTLINSTITVYQWLKKDFHTPLLILSETLTEIQPLPLYQGSYFDETVGIGYYNSAISPISFSIKNKNLLELTYELSRNSMVEFQLFEIGGREVMDIKPSMKSRGEQIEAIEIASLKSGFYILKALLGEEIIVKKLFLP